MNFSLLQPAVRVSFGAGAFERIEGEISALGRSRVMLIASASLSAARERLQGVLDDRCVAVVSSVRQHVPAEDARGALEGARAAEADCVVAIGGGSAIGLGKAVVLDSEASLVAVPTTYSGSEMTPIYGITTGEGKRTGRDERARPDAVVYDPELTTSLPADETAASGMNALAHCVEAAYAPDRSPVTSLLSTEGARLLFRALPTAVVAPGNIEARREAMLGGFYAGWALGLTTMGPHHRICHVLGGSFRISHGLANAVMLPYVVSLKAGDAGSELEPIADVFGVTVASLPRAIRDFVASLGSPTDLTAIGFDVRDAPEAARLVTTTSDPDGARFDIEELLRRACEGTLADRR
jgi:maleylacetate reductase